MEQRKELLDAVMQAVEIEKETFDFYSAAVQKSSNPAGKRIFRWLAKGEELHYLTMTELYRSLQDGRWVSYGGSLAHLEPEMYGDVEIPLDSDDRKALEIALEIEQKALAHFEALEMKSVDPQGKEMFRTIILEEKEHRRVITEKYEIITGTA